MKQDKGLEFNWKPFYDIDNGNTSIFTHVTYGHYNASGLFNGYFEDYFLDQTDNTLFSQLDFILRWRNEEGATYRTKHLLLLYGDDFTFKKANNTYQNMEKVMNYLERHPEYSDKIKFVYSTPSKYFKAVMDSKVEFPEYKNFDFFPYAEYPFSYWTGFYTSRPFLKGLIRDTGRYLFSSSRLLLEHYLKKRAKKSVMDFK